MRWGSSSGRRDPPRLRWGPLLRSSRSSSGCDGDPPQVAEIPSGCDGILLRSSRSSSGCDGDPPQVVEILLRMRWGSSSGRRDPPQDAMGILLSRPDPPRCDGDPPQAAEILLRMRWGSSSGRRDPPQDAMGSSSGVRSPRDAMGILLRSSRSSSGGWGSSSGRSPRDARVIDARCSAPPPRMPGRRHPHGGRPHRSAPDEHDPRVRWVKKLLDASLQLAGAREPPLLEEAAAARLCKWSWPADCSSAPPHPPRAARGGVSVDEKGPRGA